MGFPTWTLWGMGICVGLALLFSLLAYIAISPGLARSLRLGRLRLDLRLRTFVSFTFASLLVGSGFFAAGVPLESVPSAVPTVAVAAVEPTPDIPEVATASNQTGAMGSGLPTATATLPSETGSDGGTVSGAMGETAVQPTGFPITETAVLTATEPLLDQTPTVELTETIAAPSETPEPTATDLPTATPSPTPTETPTPTVSPTPILEETAVIDTAGATLWLHRSPGGQQLVVLQSDDVVIPTTGRANRDGLIWREVRTVDGVLGWVQERFISYSNE